MYVMQISDVLDLTKLRPHEDLLEDGLVRPYRESTDGSVLFVSHQWTSFEEPDHTGAQLATCRNRCEPKKRRPWKTDRRD